MFYTTLGIFAHIDSGKTTLTERLLYESGVISSLGSVEDGTTESDSLPEEIEHGISIRNSIHIIPWSSKYGNFQFQVIDTPGHIDFREQVVEILPSIDFAIVLLDANSALQSQARLIIEELNHRSIPVLFFINKLDLTTEDYFDALASLEGAMKTELACLFQISSEGKIQSFLSEKLVFPKGLPEKILQWSEDRLLTYWETKEDDLKFSQTLDGLFSGFWNNRISPVTGGSAKEGTGIIELLDLMSFLSKKPNIGHNANVPPALLYKRMHPDFGKVAIFKAISEIKSPLVVTNNSNQSFSMNLVTPDFSSSMHLAKPGQIFGCQIAESEEAIFINNFLLPDRFRKGHNPSFFSLFLEPEKPEDRAYWQKRLDDLLWEDGTYSIIPRFETGQWELFGHGELHLGLGIERISRKQEKKLCSSNVSIAKYELFQKMSKKVAFEHRAFETKVSSGTLTAVLEDTASFSRQFALEVSLSEEWNNVIESAFWEAIACGPKGHEILGIKMRVIDFSPPSSGFQGILSLLKVAVFSGLKSFFEGKTELIGPITETQISLDADQVGVVLAELSKRSAKIIDIAPEGTVKMLVRAKAPSENLLGFSAVLRNMTKGIGISWERTAFTFDAFAVI